MNTRIVRLSRTDAEVAQFSAHLLYMFPRVPHSRTWLCHQSPTLDSEMAFAPIVSPLLRRLFPSPRSTWLCSAIPQGRHAGRGAWDLDNPSDRSQTGRSLSSDSSYKDVYSNGKKPLRKERNGRKAEYDRSNVPKTGLREEGYENFGSYGEREERKRMYKGKDVKRGSEELRGPQRGRERMQNYKGWEYEGRREGRRQYRDGNQWDRRDKSAANDGRMEGDSEEENDGQYELDRRWSGQNHALEPRWSRRSSEEQSVVQQALAATEDDLLYGISPVLLALLSEKRGRFVRLFMQDRQERKAPTKKMENEAAYERVVQLATAKEIPVVKLSKGELNVLARNRPHQGLVLQAAQMEYREMKMLPTVEKGSVNERGAPFCYLVLDEVNDPQNAGALLRSAHFLGADGVIACKRNSCRLSAVVSKASAGALEVMQVWGVASMPRFLRAARRDGWRVIGTALREGAVSLKGVQLDQPTLVVLGSEGHGLRSMVEQECDMLVRIEGGGGMIAAELGLREEPVDSLNVSVAGAVALFQLLGQ